MSQEMMNVIADMEPSAPQEAIGGKEALLRSQDARVANATKFRNLQDEMARLQNEMERRDEMERAIRDIHTLFDQKTFFKLNHQLTLLEKAGVRGIKIGDKEYTLADVQTKTGAAEAYANSRRQNINNSLSETEIDAYLALTLGVTRGKISERSESGFRACLQRCMNDVNLNQILPLDIQR